MITLESNLINGHDMYEVLTLELIGLLIILLFVHAIRRSGALYDNSLEMNEGDDNVSKNNSE